MASSKKVLFTATIDGHIRVFHQPYLEWFKTHGYEVHVASSGIETFKNCDNKHNITFQRSPLSLANWYAYKQLKSIIKTNNFDIIHCHTPTAGVLTRLAAIQARKKGTKVIYTAHGFHFYKGSGPKNWLLFFNLEYLLSFFTDCLITINKEDFNVSKGKLKAKLIEYVHGVGVNLCKFRPVNQEEKDILREEVGVDKSAFVMVYPAEISHRKNQKMLLETVNILKDKMPSLQLLVAGRGDFSIYEAFISENKLEKHISFLGFRYDIDKLIRCSDIGISASRQEGLPINIVESMASGKPVIATNVRGNHDLVIEGKNGYLCELGDIQTMANKIFELYSNREILNQMGNESVTLSKSFSIDVALLETVAIYQKL
jgi:glycosyltransferase EpsD